MFFFSLLGDSLLVDLENMDGHPPGGGKLLVADVALEVLRLLVLYQDLLVVKFPIAVVAPYLRWPLLLLPHPLSSPRDGRVRVSPLLLPSIPTPERGRGLGLGFWRSPPRVNSERERRAGLRLSIRTRRGFLSERASYVDKHPNTEIYQ